VGRPPSGPRCRTPGLGSKAHFGAVHGIWLMFGWRCRCVRKGYWVWFERLMTFYQMGRLERTSGREERPVGQIVKGWKLDSPRTEQVGDINTWLTRLLPLSFTLNIFLIFPTPPLRRCWIRLSSRLSQLSSVPCFLQPFHSDLHGHVQQGVRHHLTLLPPRLAQHEFHDMM